MDTLLFDGWTNAPTQKMNEHMDTDPLYWTNYARSLNPIEINDDGRFQIAEHALNVMSAHIKGFLQIRGISPDGIAEEDKYLVDTKQLAGAWLDLVLDIWREQVNVAGGVGYLC